MGYLITMFAATLILIAANSPGQVPGAAPADGRTSAEVAQPSAPACSPSWHSVSFPTPSPSGVFTLNDTSAASANDVWAVGYFAENSTPPYRTLIEHWDGRQWGIVSSPNSGTEGSFLLGVSAVAPDDVWAVGYYYSAGYGQVLALHWDGTQWTAVPTPHVGEQEFLTGVSAVSTNDVWAVGYYGSVPASVILMHWDGIQWSIVPGPAPVPGSNTLLGVSAVSANDVWAVGSSGPVFGESTLVLHWDGTSWNRVPSPNAAARFTLLKSVAGVGGSEAWAVGYYGVDNPTRYGTVTLRWDGQQWSMVPSPNPAAYSALNDVSVISSGEAWAAGFARDENMRSRPLLLHLEGSQWNVVPVPDPSRLEGLSSVKAISEYDVWAVGGGDGIPSGVHADPFSDVAPTDFFGTAVNELVRRGAISGYADCTFRPAYAATRAQLCKIVVLAFDLPISNPPQPTFSDVPLTHPFYAYIESAYSYGVISGYADGTFRPGSDITRGQLCKVTVLAAAWSVLNPPVPTFGDVPPGSPFYGYIETASRRGVISGYGDGNFRPGNPATRGQIAKVVYNAITQP